jgi:hypothetical protein
VHNIAKLSSFFIFCHVYNFYVQAYSQKLYEGSPLIIQLMKFTSDDLWQVILYQQLFELAQ